MFSFGHRKHTETIAETSEDDIPKETPKRSTRKKASTVEKVQEVKTRKVTDKLAKMRELRDAQLQKAKEEKKKER